MNAVFDHFPLRGLRIGLSISAGDKSIPLGENPDTFIDRITFQTCSRFLYLGAHIVTGHKWMRLPDGLMGSLAKCASDFRFSFMGSGHPPIISRVAWPDQVPQFDEDTIWMRDVAEIEQILPEGIHMEHIGEDPDLALFARIRSLTALRRELTAQSDIRICFGGAGIKSDRLLPGVLEEAVMAWNAGKALYLSSALGGVTRLACEAILHREIPEKDLETFITPQPVAVLYQKYGETYPVPVAEGPSERGGGFDAFETFRRFEIPDLASRAFLSVDEYLALMTTPDLERALDLARTGIMRKATGMSR